MKKHYSKFNELLIILMCLFFILPLVDEKNFPFPIVSFGYLASLLFVLKPFISGLKKQLFFIAVAILAFIPEVLHRSDFFTEGNEYHLTTSIIFHIIFLIMTIFLLMKELASDKDVSDDILKGGVSIYILIGLLWGFVYSLVYRFDHHAFTIPLEDMNDIIYVSFTALLTLGSGNVAPISSSAKILFITEALVGQMFLAIFISRIVGLYIAKEMKN